MQQFEKIVRKREEPPMRWLPVLPIPREERNVELREFMGGIRDDIRALIGTHYYFIRCGAGRPGLCRIDLYTRGKYPSEVVDHDLFGITDDDIGHAIMLDEGDGTARGYYRISDHIEGKLRALLDA